MHDERVASIFCEAVGEEVLTVTEIDGLDDPEVEASSWIVESLTDAPERAPFGCPLILELDGSLLSIKEVDLFSPCADCPHSQIDDHTEFFDY